MGDQWNEILDSLTSLKENNLMTDIHSHIRILDLVNNISIVLRFLNRSFVFIDTPMSLQVAFISVVFHDCRCLILILQKNYIKNFPSVEKLRTFSLRCSEPRYFKLEAPKVF